MTPQFTVIEPLKSIIHHKNSRKHKQKLDLTEEEYLEKTFTWSLSMGVSFILDDEMEVAFEPAVKNLADKIDSETILLRLYDNDIFDFDYQPSENDCFIIRYKYIHEHIKKRLRPFCNFYMSFIFRNGQWEEDYYRCRIIVKEVKFGVIKWN